MIIEIFKNWISSMLCIGIFIAFVQLIMPNSNLKKYIYSLIGIVTVLTVVSPIINVFKNETVGESVRAVLANISNTDDSVSEVNEEKIKQENEENIKKEFVNNVKRDVRERLVNQNIAVKNVEILLLENYDIDKIEVTIGKIDEMNSSLKSVNKVVQYINTQYDISFSKIVVIEEGI